MPTYVRYDPTAQPSSMRVTRRRRPPLPSAPPNCKRHTGSTTSSIGGVTGNGAGQTIAIIDAYDDPNIASDLATYDSTMNIPATNFTFTKDGVSSSNGTLTSTLPCGRDTTNSEQRIVWLGCRNQSGRRNWPHAMAPGANILLVEANSSSVHRPVRGSRCRENRPRRLRRVDELRRRASITGETSYDSIFTSPSSSQPITFIASTGDDGSPAEYPAYSPNVLAVGGTTLNQSNGVYESETAWSDSGGGISDHTKPSLPTRPG